MPPAFHRLLASVARSSWAVCFLLAAANVVSAAGTPTVTITTNYYGVAGTNLMLIGKSLAASRPFAATNTFDAFTHWTVGAEYDFRPNAGMWTLHHLRVKAVIKVTLPRWIPGVPVSPELVQTWSEYVANLTKHELGHVQFAREAAEEVQRQLDSLPSSAAAPEANKAAQSIVNEVIEDYRSRERKFDRETHHGRNQGAILQLGRPSGSPGKA